MSNKELKARTAEELSKKIEAAKIVVLSEFAGLNVEDITQLRKSVRQASGTFKVVKNSISRRALGGRYPELEGLLTGPNALALGAADPVEVVKKLVEFAKNHPQLKIKGGVMEGEAVTASELAAISKLPARDVLMAQLLAALNAPLASLLGVMQANVQSFLALLRGIEEKKAGETPPAA
jgi:large subunit ribosomal protein L10